jgi:hypothetical protein
VRWEKRCQGCAVATRSVKGEKRYLRCAVVTCTVKREKRCQRCATRDLQSVDDTSPPSDESSLTDESSCDA